MNVNALVSYRGIGSIVGSPDRISYSTAWLDCLDQQGSSEQAAAFSLPVAWVRHFFVTRPQIFWLLAERYMRKFLGRGFELTSILGIPRY